MMYTKARMTILTLMVVLMSLLSSSTTSAAKNTKMLFDGWLKRFPKSYAYSLTGGSDTNLRKSSGENDGSRNSNNNNYNIDINNVDEYLKRFEIFKTNLNKIHKHNEAYQLGLTSYVMTIYNEFGDMTDDEFTSQYLMESQNCSATTGTGHKSSGKLRPPTSKQQQNNHHPKDTRTSFYKPDLNKSIDWRTKGVITPIKNQKHCGSCWTFSTTGCLEAHTCIQAKAASITMDSKANKAYDGDDDDDDSNEFDCTSWTGLAEQQLVDCAQPYNNFGCNGGLPSQAYEYIKYNGGIDFESSYPYKANETGSCLFTPNGIGSRVAEVFNITTKDEDDLEYAIGAIGPVSIAYQVSHDFRHYSHGVYDSFNATTNTTMCNNTAMDVNHAVVAVGLGTTQVDKAKNITKSQPYYIVRNSWGTSWGMEGYFWMERGTNLCGVSDCASFPLVPRKRIETYKTNKNDLLNHAMESASSIL